MIYPVNPENPDYPVDVYGFEQYTYQPMAQTQQQYYVNGGMVYQPSQPQLQYSRRDTPAIPQYAQAPTATPTFGTPTYVPSAQPQMGFNQLVESRRDIPQIPNPATPQQNLWGVQSYAQPTPVPQYVGQQMQPVSFGNQPTPMGMVPTYNWPVDKKTSAWNDTTVCSPFVVPQVNWNATPVAAPAMSYYQPPQYPQFEQPQMQVDWLAYANRNFPSAK